MARHSMRESRSLTLASSRTNIIVRHTFSIVILEMTKMNVVVFVLAPDQRHIHSNYASRYSYAPGAGLIFILATVGLFFKTLVPSRGLYGAVMYSVGGDTYYITVVNTHARTHSTAPFPVDASVITAIMLITPTMISFNWST